MLPDTAATLYQLVSFDLECAAGGDDATSSSAPSAAAGRGGGPRRYDCTAFGKGSAAEPLIIGARVATARSLDLGALGGGVAPGEFGVLSSS